MELAKVIITIPKAKYQYIQELECGNTDYATTRMLYHAVKKGTPLDSNSERAEVQAYFDGEAYGWEQGRKALIDDVKAEIEASMYCDKDTRLVENANASGLKKALEIIDKHTGNTESEGL